MCISVLIFDLHAIFILFDPPESALEKPAIIFIKPIFTSAAATYQHQKLPKPNTSDRQLPRPDDGFYSCCCFGFHYSQVYVLIILCVCTFGRMCSLHQLAHTKVICCSQHKRPVSHKTLRFEVARCFSRIISILGSYEIAGILRTLSISSVLLIFYPSFFVR